MTDMTVEEAVHTAIERHELGTEDLREAYHILKDQKGRKPEVDALEHQAEIANNT